MSSSARTEDALPGLLRRMNLRRVLESLRELGPASRADLCRHTGISPPTMTLLVEQLISSQLVEPAPEPPPRGQGRPGVRFRLATRSVYVLGAVIDAGQCTVTASGMDGAIEAAHTHTFDTPSRYETLLDLLQQALQGVAAAREGACRGVGLTVPGLADREEGRACFSPNMHIIDGRFPGRDLAARLNLPVILLQEEQAMSLAAQSYGEARGVRDFALVDVATGFGMGVVVNGSYLKGSRGFGGELGHVTVDPQGRRCGCGNIGCLETVACDTALARAYSQKKGRPATIDDLVRMANEGDWKPGDLLERTLNYLAIGVAAVINIFNPELVLMHGRMFDLQADALDRLREKTSARALKPSFGACRIARTRTSKPQAAVAGVIRDICDQAGPPLPG